MSEHLAYKHRDELLEYITQLEAKLKEAKLDSKRLDTLERAMRAGHSIDAYGWDDEKNEWGKAGIGVLFKDSCEDGWSGADLLADNVRDVIDKLEEQDHE